MAISPYIGIGSPTDLSSQQSNLQRAAEAMTAPTYPTFHVSPCKNGYVITKGSDRWVAQDETMLVEVLKLIAVVDKVSG